MVTSDSNQMNYSKDEFEVKSSINDDGIGEEEINYQNSVESE